MQDVAIKNRVFVNKEKIFFLEYSSSFLAHERHINLLREAAKRQPLELESQTCMKKSSRTEQTQPLVRGCLADLKSQIMHQLTLVIIIMSDTWRRVSPCMLNDLQI